MKRWLLCVLLLACKGSTSTGGDGTAGANGSQGPTGPTGATGPQGPGLPTVDGGAVFTCKPADSWCEGNVLNTCTRGGHDATQYDCTSSDSIYYSYTCESPCTTSKSPACCKYIPKTPTSPTATCAWALTAPENISGDTTTATQEFSCQGPNPCPSSDSQIYAYFRRLPHVCPSTGYGMTFRLQRNMVSVGQTITLPNAAVLVSEDNFAPAGVECNSGAWSGTVHFDADIPNWKITFNVTCTAGSSAHFAGVLSGTTVF